MSTVDEPASVPAVGSEGTSPARPTTTGTAPADTPADGRLARSVRTRKAIVDACISLAEEGDLRPTTPRIADRAGVSVRSVFQHFDGLESLYAAVAERVVERAAGLVEPVDTGLALERRVAEAVRQRSAVLEATTPIRRASAVHAPFSAELTARIRRGQELFRAHTADIFAPELATLPSEEAEVLLDILGVLLGWPTWETLRTTDGRTEAEARATVVRMVDGALAAAGFEVATGS